MRTEEYILEKLKEFKLDISKIGSAKREVALLPTILGDSEELLDLTPGAIGNVMGIIACTDERVVLFEKYEDITVSEDGLELEETIENVMEVLENQ